MTTAPHRITDEEGTLVAGKVLLHDGERFSVALGRSRELRARRAASCLLAPEPGDRVLVARVGEEAFVLAVLERDGARPAELAIDGDAALRASGRLELRAQQGIGITTDRLEVHAREGSFSIRRIAAFAKEAAASFDALSLLARTTQLVAETVSERVQRAYRSVEEYEQLRARHIDYRAEQTAQIKAETTVMVAKRVARIDGEQVHIG